jgi:ankyrin repeat protein
MAKKFSPQDVMDLLERGVDLNRPDSYDRTLIEWAAIHNRLDLVELLVARGLPVRQALAYAEQNLEFFPEYAVLADYLRKLSPGPT